MSYGMEKSKDLKRVGVVGLALSVLYIILSIVYVDMAVTKAEGKIMNRLGIGWGKTVLKCMFMVLCALSHISEASVNIRTGWDWSLSNNVSALDYSGFVAMRKPLDDPLVTVVGEEVSWKELNPMDGVYRWGLVRKLISDNKRLGFRTGLHLKSVEAGNVPDWVINKYKPGIMDMQPLKGSQTWRLQNVVPWGAGVEKEYLKFLHNLAEINLCAEPNLAYAYINGISPSRGEELWMREVDEKVYRKNGLNGMVLRDWIRNRVDGMLSAFGECKGKLAWMAPGPIGVSRDFKDSTKDLWKYAEGKGVGIRGGGIDFQHQLFESEAWGVRVDSNGYVIVDDNHPTIIENRYRGDENEEYGSAWEWRFGDMTGHAYRHRISSLRALQMRMNFLVVSAATLSINTDLNKYVKVSLGRNRLNSPDAWAYLRECRVRYKSKPIKNIERWLEQRDVPGGMTVAVDYVARFPLPSDRDGENYDLDARRTNLAKGQSNIYFRIDKVFWPKSSPAIVKVTYYDNSKSRWQVVASDSTGREVKSEEIKGVADGVVKTASFTVDDFSASGRLGYGMDFALRVNNEEDLVVKMVRVIKR